MWISKEERNMNVFFLLSISCQVIDKQHEILERKAKQLDMKEEIIHNSTGHVFGWIEQNDKNQQILVLIHGFGGDGLWTWGSNIDSFAKDYRIILPDLLWFGGSYSDIKPSLQNQADEIWNYIEAHKKSHEKVSIMGVSYGGFVALQLVQDHSSELQSVIIVDSPGGNFDDQAISELNQRFHISDPADLFVPTQPEQIQRLLDLCMFKPIPPLPQRMLTQIYERDFSTFHEQRRNLLAELPKNRDQYLKYEGPTPPMLVVWGEQDEVFPVEFGQKLSSDFDAELFVIPNTRHAPNIEKPKVFEKKVLEFLQSNNELHYKKQSTP